MTRVLSALVVLLLIALPTAAIAQDSRTNAPPGNSAIDEYLETVPGATGNARPRAPGTGGESATLSAAERARLERLGPDGKVLADAVDATLPVGATPKKGTAQPPTAQGRSPLREVLGSATGDDGGGMGVLLPAILIASLLGTVALLVARRRSVS